MCEGEKKRIKKTFEIKKQTICKKLIILYDNELRGLLQQLRNCVWKDM
jgi:hypothetical protein